MALTPEQLAAFDEVWPDETAGWYGAAYAVLDFERYCELEGLGLPDDADMRAEIALADFDFSARVRKWLQGTS